MGTNSYVTKLKAQLDQAIIQRDHWKQLAENRNSIVVTEVCPESRSVEEYIIDADSVRASWRLIRQYREQAEALWSTYSVLVDKLGIDTEKAKTADGKPSDVIVSYVEALRAENGRLSANIARLTSNPADHRYWEGRYRDAEAELEAARGLLERASSILGSQGYGAWDSLAAEIDALLTATPAPDAPGHTEQHLEMVEQGERQEAVGQVRATPDGKQYASLYSNSGQHLDGAKLYTIPQPGPDVRSLVEAAQQADDVLSAIVRNDQPIETLKREYGEEWSSAIDTVRASLVTQIATHRQAQHQ